jgi:hypothetical protein
MPPRRRQSSSVVGKPRQTPSARDNPVPAPTLDDPTTSSDTGSNRPSRLRRRRAPARITDSPSPPPKRRRQQPAINTTQPPANNQMALLSHQIAELTGALTTVTSDLQTLKTHVFASPSTQSTATLPVTPAPDASCTLTSTPSPVQTTCRHLRRRPHLLTPPLSAWPSLTLQTQVPIMKSRGHLVTATYWATLSTPRLRPAFGPWSISTWSI